MGEWGLFRGVVCCLALAAAALAPAAAEAAVNDEVRISGSAAKNPDGSLSLQLTMSSQFPECRSAPVLRQQTNSDLRPSASYIVPGQSASILAFTGTGAELARTGPDTWSATVPPGATFTGEDFENGGVTQYPAAASPGIIFSLFSFDTNEGKIKLPESVDVTVVRKGKKPKKKKHRKRRKRRVTRISVQCSIKHGESLAVL